MAADRSLLGHPEAAALAERSRLSSIERRIEVERRRERYLAIPTREEQASAQSHPERLGLVDHYSGRVRPRLDCASSARAAGVTSLVERVASRRGRRCLRLQVLRLARVEARRAEEIDYEPSALNGGGSVHDVLRELFSQPIDFRDPDRALAQARKFLVEYRPTAQARTMAREAVLFELELADLERIVEELVELACDEFREGAFNQKPLLEEPFEFTLHGRGAAEGVESIDLVLRGRFDRLDFSRNRQGLVDRIRIRDYKTSRSRGWLR